MDADSLRSEALALAQIARKAAAEDDSLEVRGIVWLEHVNVVTGDRRLAEIFYLDGLGLVRDPGRSLGVTLWANIGPRQQLHLVDPGKKHDGPTVVDGCMGLAMTDLRALLGRLEAVSEALSGTSFCYADLGGCVYARCPWGNRFFVYPTETTEPVVKPDLGRPLARLEEMHLEVDCGMAVRGQAGIRFVQWRCSDAAGVGRFYEDVFNCVVRHEPGHAAVCVGPSVHLIFSTASLPRDPEQLRLAEGVHICIYICEFKRCHDLLKQHGVIWTNSRFADIDRCDNYQEAVAGRQWRFKVIRDLGDSSAEPFCELEHEVRSLRHIQFMKEVPF